MLPSNFSERRLLFFLGAVQFVNILDFVIIMPLAPQLIAEQKVSPGQLGLLVSSYMIAAALSGLVAARWVNRNPRKKALLLAFGVFVVATLACGVAHNYYALLAARTIAGLAGGPATSIVLTIVADAIPIERRGRALAFVQSAFSIASVVGVPAGLYLANYASWRAPFLALAALAGALWFGIAKMLPAFDAHVGKTGAEKGPWKTWLEVISDRRSVHAYLVHAFMMIGGFALIPFLSPYLVNNRAVPQDQLGMFYLVGGACTFVMMQFVGKWTDRFGSLRLYATVSTLLAINMQIILWAPFSGLQLVPLFAVFMVCNSGRMVPMMTLYSKIPPPETRGAFMSYLSTVQHLSSGLGTLIAGVFLTLGPDGKLENFTLVAEVTVAFTLSVIFLARTLSAPIIEKSRAH